jgi:hypothetical protein
VKNLEAVPEVAELRETLVRLRISALEAGRHIGVTGRTVYAWLDGSHTPTAFMRRQIKLGLPEIERAYHGGDRLEQRKALFKIVWPHLSAAEKEQAARAAVLGTDEFTAYLKAKAQHKHLDLGRVYKLMASAAKGKRS